MTTLREQIKEKHDLAEHSAFAKLLLSGNITKEVYADFLYNQRLCYTALEARANEFGLTNDFPEINRCHLITEDLLELNVENVKIYQSSAEYVKHINTLEPKLLLAHLYVRHFGDMYGGQMIKKVIPSSGKMYEFENRKELIDKVRAVLTEDLGDEANVCFQFVIDLYQELCDEHNIR